MPRIHDDNPNPGSRGDRRASRGLRQAPATGDVVGRGSHPGAYDNDDDDDNGPIESDLERFGGETKTCPECGKEVYDDTAVCYHCGHAFEGNTADAPSKSKTWIIVTVIVLVVLFALAAGSGLF